MIESMRAAFALPDLRRRILFTITLLVTLENLGFCKPGEGGAFVENGRIGLGGALPCNPDGGLKHSITSGRVTPTFNSRK